MKIENCPFYEGIDTCNITKCDKNILGMCAKKGSKNHPKIRHRTIFERFKLMSIEETAEAISKLFCGEACPCYEQCTAMVHSECINIIKAFLESEVEEE